MTEELNEAIAAVSKEASAELDAGGEEEVVSTEEKVEAKAEEKVDETPETPAATDTPERSDDGRFVAKPDEATEEVPKEEETTEEEPLGLSPELLQRINESPDALEVYKSMQSGFTKKTQELAEQRKSNQEKADIADWIRANPDAALEELARIQKRSLVKAGSPETKSEPPVSQEVVVDELTKTWEKKLGPEASSILKPLIEETAAAVTANLIKTQIDPLRERTDALDSAKNAAGIESRIKSFGASKTEGGQDWNQEISDEMARSMEHIDAGPNATFDQYMDSLYGSVMYQRGRTTLKKSEIKRLKKAKSTAEPSTTVRTTTPAASLITGEMTERDAIRAATEAAIRENAAR